MLHGLPETGGLTCRTSLLFDLETCTCSIGTPKTRIHSASIKTFESSLGRN